MVEARVDGRRKRTVESRAQMIDAAEVLFSTVGFHATSLRALAASIGMTHAGVLQHFATKDDLLLALIGRSEERTGALFRDLDLSELSPREVMRLVTENALRTPRAIELYMIILGEAADPRHPAREQMRRRSDRIKGLLDDALGPAGTHAFAMWDGLQLAWLYVPERVHPPADLDEIIVSITQWTPYPSTTADLRGAGPREAAVERSRREDIIAAASAGFARNGYRSTSLRSIAADLGTSHGSVLYHFATKVALLEAVLDDVDVLDRATWTAEQTPLDAIYAIYLRARHNAAHPELIRLHSVLVCEATDPAHPAHEFFAGRFNRFIDDMTRLLESLRAAGLLRDGVDPANSALRMAAAWNGLQLHSFYEEGLDIPELMRGQLNALLTVELPAR
jgi:AcrR family transcriptional regulator